MKLQLWLIGLLLISCTKSFSSKEDLIRYVKNEKNGYTQTKQVNDILYELTFQPVDFLICKTSETILNEELDSLRSIYNNYIHISLSLSKDGKEILTSIPQNREEYSFLSQQLSFGLADKVSLVSSQSDTLALIDYNFSKMYGMSHSNTLLFVFDYKEQATNDYTFKIEDFGIRTGDVKFTISEEQLKNQPKIKL